MWRLLIFLSLCVAWPGLVTARTSEPVASERLVGIDGDFPAFIREFFRNVEFQKERTRFPLPIFSLTDEWKEANVYVDKSNWTPLRGPKHFECAMDCFDTVVYDNFERRPLRETGQRVFSFVGVENGINESYYFELIKGRWFLVKRENFST